MARTPMAAPAFEMASMAYSTWYNRPSGLKIVVLESYRLAILSLCCGPDHFIDLPVCGADGLNTLSCKFEDVFALLQLTKEEKEQLQWRNTARHGTTSMETLQA